MASKQLGKLRQWAGEVISSKEKTTVTPEFQELEQDVDLRKAGAARLLIAAEAYLQHISKKKLSESLQEEKLLPIDTFGVVMLMHGEEFPHDSAYGTSLIKYGRAHSKVATLQEAFALTFEDTFLASLRKFGEDVKEYEQQRKKLESRRLSFDAAVSKAEKLKGAKKEKEKRDAEEEVERARQRYLETEEDVEALMHAIQDTEIAQHRELSMLLDLEINYVEQYLEVLKDIKNDWKTVASNGIPTRPKAVSRQNSLRSNRSLGRTAVESSEDDGSPPNRPAASRRSSTRTNEPPSRPTSRLSRNRSNSGANAGRSPDGEAEKDKEKEKEKDKDKDKDKEKTKRLSVAGWATSAVGSMTGSLAGKKNKDKDKFTTLPDDEGGAATSESRTGTLKKSSSTHSLGIIPRMRSKSRDNASTNTTPGSSPPKVASRILKPPSLQGKKVVRALFDFSGSSDELSFKVGDEITVVNEVLDGWWMGELEGKRGLFPTPYVEVVTAIAKPSVPPRKDRRGSLNKRAKRQGEDIDDPDDDSRASILSGYDTNDLDDDLDFNRPPLTPKHNPFFGGHLADTLNITSGHVDPDEPTPRPTTGLNGFGKQQQQFYGLEPSGGGNSSPPRRSPIPPPSVPSGSAAAAAAAQAALTASPGPRRATTSDAASTPAKRAPPPPPPPRRATNAGLTGPPSPESLVTANGGSNGNGNGNGNGGGPLSRRSHSFSSISSASLAQTNGQAQAVNAALLQQSDDHGPAESPFETPDDMSNGLRGLRGPGPSVKGCRDFRQNPFKPKGLCNNCFEYHSS